MAENKKVVRKKKRPQSPYAILQRNEERSARNRLLIMGAFVLITIVLTLLMIRLIIKSTAPEAQIFIVREGTITNEIYTKALITRDEIPLDAPATGVFSPMANDGDKLAKDSLLGTIIDQNGAEAWQNVQEINKKISERQLELIAEGSFEPEESDFIQTDSRITPLINQLRDLDSNQIAESKLLMSQLKVLVQERNDRIFPKDSNDEIIKNLLIEKKKAEEALASYSTSFTVPESGIIAYNPDDLTGKYTTEDIKNLPPAEVENIMKNYSTSIKSPDRNVRSGELAVSLIKNPEQSFSIVLEGGSYVDYPLDRTYSLELYETGINIKQARLEQAKEEDGKLYLVFKTDEELENLINQRVVAAKILLESDKGLKVPLEVLQFPDPEHNTRATIMMVVSGYVYEEPVEVLRKDGDYAIIAAAVGAQNELAVGSVIVQNPQAVKEGEAFAN